MLPDEFCIVILLKPPAFNYVIVKTAFDASNVSDTGMKAE
jgi:hypothetical protein